MKTHFFESARRLSAWGAAAIALVLAGCASRPVPAPVEDRPVRSAPGSSRTTPPPATPPVATPPRPAGAPAATAAPAAPAPAAEPADATPRPGFYTVRPGDTLGRIALDHGQSWRDLARWNGLENPNLIEVGQQLRVIPPGAEPGAAMARPVTPAGRVESRPLDGRATASAAGPAAPGSTPGAQPGATSSAAAAPGVPAPPAVATGAQAAGASPGAASASPAPTRDPDEDVAWAWPAAGPLLAGYDEARQAKGLAIGGKTGDPVLAAADGRVVYAGSGLRGYGNLVIVKHNALFLSAYAHNQTLLVKEDQVVRRGQKIAEMGASEADRVQLHFEIRRQGRPVDPARLLPPR
jgi:lipoprotein NlpD